MTSLLQNPDYPFSLAVERLALPVYLGAGDEERAVEQTVYVSLTLFYPKAPDAAQQDAAEYLCYDGLCQSLLAVAAREPFHLIEFLAAELFRTVREAAPKECKVWLRLQKPLPVSLVGYAVEGAAIELSDLGAQP